MQTIWYLILWLLAVIAAFGVGGVTHYSHAHWSAYPTQLFDGGSLSDAVLNEVFSPRYNLIGDYDDAGWWEFYSLKNYLLHVTPWLFLVVATGLINWPHQAEMIARVCTGVGVIGLTPVFCG